MIRGELALARESLRKPYPVSWQMVLLVSIVPVYLWIAERAKVGTSYAPELALDRIIPVVPAWSLVYGALYGFLIALPVFVVRQPPHIRRTVHAYLFIWLTAYAVFLLYPTHAPRADSDSIVGDSFAAWGLRALYGGDPPYNCFPSLHVAHSFVSAFTCIRVHRRLGMIATLIAVLVALSTLFTKQHYVLDVMAGAALAGLAWWLFLRTTPGEVPELDRRLAPTFAGITAAVVCVGFLFMAGVYLTGFEP